MSWYKTWLYFLLFFLPLTLSARSFAIDAELESDIKAYCESVASVDASEAEFARFMAECETEQKRQYVEESYDPPIPSAETIDLQMTEPMAAESIAVEPTDDQVEPQTNQLLGRAEVPALPEQASPDQLPDCYQQADDYIQKAQEQNPDLELDFDRLVQECMEEIK